MTDVTQERTEYLPNAGGKMVVLKTGTTVTGGTDTVTLDLAEAGITNVLAVEEFVHTTDYSVITKAQPTTTVSGDTLTVTVSSGNDNKRRVVAVFGE